MCLFKPMTPSLWPKVFHIFVYVKGLGSNSLKIPGFLIFLHDISYQGNRQFIFLYYLRFLRKDN